jgi:cytoskeletal protein RodZ
MTNNEPKNISQLLIELLKERGITVEKLAIITNIPQRFIAALLNGEFKKLPAKPYVRGYLIKIAGVLNVKPEDLLKSYQDTTEITSSGERDRLPVNRFALQRVNNNFLITLFILAAAASFLTWRMKDILGTPTLQLNLPANTLVTQEESLKITGRINPKDRLTINQEIVYTDNTGQFEKTISLSPGLNLLEFNVRRFLGREIKAVRQIYYEANNKTATPSIKENNER